MTKKRIATMATCIALVGAVVVGGTLALLTEPSNTVTNSFSVGDGYPDVDEVLTLTESPVKQLANGNYVVDEGERVRTNTYDKLVANATIAKDPKFTLVTGSPDSWIVAHIGTVDEDLEGTVTSNWIKVKLEDGKYVLDREDKTVSSNTYYIYNATVTPQTDIPALFTSLTVDGTVEAGDMQSMVIKGCAVQAVGDDQTVETAVDTVVTAAAGAMG